MDGKSPKRSASIAPLRPRLGFSGYYADMTIARNSIIVYYSNAILNAMLLKRQQLL